VCCGDGRNCVYCCLGVSELCGQPLDATPTKVRRFSSPSSDAKCWHTSSSGSAHAETSSSLFCTAGSRNGRDDGFRLLLWKTGADLPGLLPCRLWRSIDAGPPRPGEDTRVLEELPCQHLRSIGVDPRPGENGRGLECATSIGCRPLSNSLPTEQAASALLEAAALDGTEELLRASSASQRKPISSVVIPR